jgi:hypothetical protein
VSGYLAKHDGFADVTDPVQNDVLTWLTKVLA